MYIRRYYYNKLTGNTLYSYMMQGDIIIPTVKQDTATYLPLQSVSAEVVGYVEWTEPDSAVETNFLTATSVRFDLATNEIIFDTTPIEPIEPVIPPNVAAQLQTDIISAEQSITDLELNQIEQGQYMTELELLILGGEPA